MLHAPIIVVGETLLPDHANLIKSWKELLLALAIALLTIQVVRQKKTTIFLKDWLIILPIIYAVIHVLVIWLLPQSPEAMMAGVLIDLRYVAVFVALYVTVKLYPGCRAWFVKLFWAGAAVVLGFALLQLTVLPHDILKHIGYNESTILPYMTVDKDADYIRINSTLRGPNPLGAYAVIVITILAAILYKTRKRWSVVVPGIVASLLTIWSTHSRGALLGAATALAITTITIFRQRIGYKTWIVGCLVIGALIGGIFALRSTEFVSTVVFHESPESDSVTKSNDQHIKSLVQGFNNIASQPQGWGVGSTGSASLLGDNSIIIENQFMFIAHEVGAIGFAVFLCLFIMILIRLWAHKQDPLALGLFASGIGLSVVGIFLPVWADDTVSIVWWSLAGVVIGFYGGKEALNERSGK